VYLNRTVSLTPRLCAGVQIAGEAVRYYLTIDVDPIEAAMREHGACTMSCASAPDPALARWRPQYRGLFRNRLLHPHRK